MDGLVPSLRRLFDKSQRMQLLWKWKGSVKVKLKLIVLNQDTGEVLDTAEGISYEEFKLAQISGQHAIALLFPLNVGKDK
jgi:hypothetical protein